VKFVGNKGNIIAAYLAFSLFLEASATSNVTIYYGNLKRQKIT
jgi:threonine synthase